MNMEVVPASYESAPRTRSQFLLGIYGIHESDLRLVMNGGSMEDEDVRKRILADGKNAADNRVKLTNASMTNRFELVKLKTANTFFVRPKDLSSTSPVMTRLDEDGLRTLVKKTHLTLFPNRNTASELKTAYDTVVANIDSYVDAPSKRFMLTGDNHIWDSEAGDLMTLDEFYEKYEFNLPYVFYKFFDTDMTIKNVIKMPALNPDDEKQLLSAYKETIEELRNNNLGMRIKVFREWAQDKMDVYKDIMFMYANTVMSRPMTAVWFPFGVGRNGKSVCSELLQTILGYNNCARVPISELSDPHHISELTGCLANLPDETNDGILKDTASFKTLADHGILSVTRLYKDTGAQLYGSFVTICPINHLPKWKGEDAQACLNRTWPIPFRGNFRSDEMALSNRSYGEINFTKDVVVDILGRVLGMAHYYSQPGHVWEETPTMLLERDMIMEATSSLATFQRSFTKFVRGWVGPFKDMVAVEYRNYCAVKELELEPISKNSVFWSQFNLTKFTSVNNKKVRVTTSEAQWVEKKGLIMFSGLQITNNTNIGFQSHADKHVLMDGRALADYHVAGGSLIAELEESDLFEAPAQEQLRLRMEAKK